MINTAKPSRCVLRVLLALLVSGAFCTAANAAVTVIGVQYQPDNMHPEFACIWDSSNYPTSCPSNFAGANVRVFLKNTGAGAVNVTNVTLAGYELKTIIKERVQGGNDPYSIYYYWDDPPAAIFNAGEPVWYRHDPTNIPAGAVFQVIVRLRLVPATAPVSVGVMTDAGTVTTNITVDATAPQVASVGFVPVSTDPVVKSSVNKVYLHWRRSGGTAPTSIYLDGNNVTSLGATVTTVNDTNLNSAVSLVSFTNSLSYMSYHIYQGVYADGKKATAGLRTWVNRFNYGTYGAGPTTNKNDGKAWIDSCQARGVNLLIWNNGSDGFTDLINTAEGQTYAKEHEYDFMPESPSQWNTTDPMGWYLRDEPDAHDNHITRNDNDNPPNLCLPQNDQHNVGVLAMHEIFAGDSLHYAQGEITPTAVNIDGTYKPYNFFTYGPMTDLAMSDPYYQRRLCNAYWYDNRLIPLYEKATYIHATSVGLTAGAEPNSSLLIMYSNEYHDPNNTNNIWPYPPPATKRIEAYYALGGGAKGMGYWWFLNNTGDTNADGAFGLGLYTPDALTLWKEIGLLGNEFKMAQPLISISHPAALTVTPSTNIWARGLIAGIDSLLLVIANDRYTNDQAGCHYTPISNSTVTVTLPSWFNGSATSFEIAEGAEGVKDVSSTLNGNQLQVTLGTVNVTKLIVVTTNAALRATIGRRYIEKSYQGVCSFAPEHCPSQTTCILNPGAEEGFRSLGSGTVANNWLEWEGPYGTNIIGFDETSIKHTGSHSQRIRAQIPNGGWGGLYQRIPALPGTNYTISVWMYAGDTSTKCYLGVDPKGGIDGNSTNVVWSSVHSSVSWVQKTWTGNAVSNFMTVFYKVQTTTGVRNGYFDDATPACTSPTLTQQPAATNLCAGGNATFTVAVSGPGTASYQWQKNGINLTAAGHYSGVTTATLTVTGVDSGDAASYRCVVTTSYGVVTSSTADLTLKAATTITLQPSAQSVCTGSNATFTVAATGDGTITYQWQTNGVNISNSSHYGGCMTATLTVTNVASADGVNYRCVVTAGCGSSTSFQALLTVRPPTTVTGQPSAQNVCPGANANFSVTATGDGTLTYQWQKNQVNLSNGGHYSGVTTATLTITGANGTDTANYRCVVTGGCGSANSSEAALTLKALTTITGQPSAQNVCPGANANFSVTATGDGTLTYQWQKNQANLSNGGHYSGVTTATLTITGADGTDAANYRCVVTGGCGSVNSSEAALTLKAATTITGQPSAQNVCPGVNVSFGVTATGDGTLTYQWQTNSVNITNSAHYGGCTTAALWVTNAQSADAVNYRCVVTGGCGISNSSTAALTLRPATIVTSHPTNRLVSAGATTNFSVAATGEGTLTYQWQTNGVNITNNSHCGGCTTATLWVTNAQSADTVNYRCVVTAGCGSVNSREAQLIVNTCVATASLLNAKFDIATNSWTVATNWTSYSSGSSAFSKNTSICQSSPNAQRIRPPTSGAGAYGGVRQTVPAGLGEAVTFKAYAYNESSSTYIKTHLGVKWDGSTTVPSPFPTTNTANATWTQLTVAGQATTANGVTVFLHTLRGTTGTYYSDFDTVDQYRCYMPLPPLVTSASSTSLNVDVIPGCNSTNSVAEYAITIGGNGYTLGTHWVQANGSVSTAVVWQTDATWATKTVTNLTAGTTYTFKVQARYSSTISQATALSAGGNGTP